MPKILDGKWVRGEILNELAPRVQKLTAAKRPPGLAVVLVGDNPASAIYVRNKVQACRELGIHSEKFTPPESVTTAELIALIQQLNARPDLDGILVQMPLPPQVDSQTVIAALSPEKDVDGFHPFNTGALVANRPGPRPCTPAGVIELLRRYGIPLRGKRAVVLGRSDIVGKPMAMMLLHQHATVTICHSNTQDLPGECLRADILVAAIGRAAFVRGSWIRPGATVIDVGINRVTDARLAADLLRNAPDRLAAFHKNGSTLVGDVHPSELEHVYAYTPVPGGVGPLTIAMLMANTVASAERRLGAD
jgi:methylenetetrahydrofolate dehydrogenase (NADP+)/methenyltetrahydrofolate cyclohydrolase